MVIEDGPTVTHGEMSYGAGYLAAKQFGAKKILEPKNWASGRIKRVFENYPHLRYVLPAVGYSKAQLKDLQDTINASPCQTVISATPIDLSGIIKIEKPLVRVSYRFASIERSLKRILKEAHII